MSDESWTAGGTLNQLKEAMGNKGMTVDEMFAALDGDSDGKINGPELHKGILEHLGDLLSPGQNFPTSSSPWMRTATIALTSLSCDLPSAKRREGCSGVSFGCASTATASEFTRTWGSWSVTVRMPRLRGANGHPVGMTAKTSTGRFGAKCSAMRATKKRERSRVERDGAPKVKSHRRDGCAWPPRTSPTRAKNT